MNSGARRDAVKKLAADHGFFKAKGFEAFLNGGNAQMIDQTVGGGVITDGDHQLAQRADVHFDIIGEQRQRAADGHFILLRDEEFILHVQLSFQRML